MPVALRKGMFQITSSACSMVTSGVAERDQVLYNYGLNLNGYTYADVAELVDALASGASVRKNVEVQVLSSAPY